MEQLGAAGHVELVENRRDVVLERLFGVAGDARHFLGGQSLEEQARNITLFGG